MVAALQAPPRPPRSPRPSGRRAPARVVPLRPVPDLVFPDDVPEPQRVVQVPDRRVVHRQPRPRATRSQSAVVYRRRRLVAAALGLGLVLTAAHAGFALGGSTTTPGRGPHPHMETVVVQSGDTLWTIAQRLEPGSDPRSLVDKLSAQLGTSDLQPGMKLRVAS
jgi:LysM domain